jgi:hypothetical protein
VIAVARKRAIDRGMDLDTTIDRIVCAYADATGGGPTIGDYTRTSRSALTRRMEGVVGGSFTQLRSKLSHAIDGLTALHVAMLDPMQPANLARIHKESLVTEVDDFSSLLNAIDYVADAIENRGAQQLQKLHAAALDERRQARESSAARQTPEAKRHEAINWIEFLIRPDGLKDVATLAPEDRTMLVEKFAAALGVST